jgi:hypothetical protein
MALRMAIGVIAIALPFVLALSWWRDILIGGVHYSFAAALFGTLAYISLVPLTKKSANPTLRKVAIVAFGMSWLTKGEAILGDQLPATVPTTT